MDNLQIATGEKRLTINGDPQRVIVFNPEDVLFVERFYRMIGELDAKQAEYEASYAEIDADQSLDAHGIPANAGRKIELLKTTCAYFREQIDRIFGAGTSQIAFGDAMSLSMFEQFLDGIAPFVRSPRAEKMAPYVNTAVKPKRARHTKNK